MPAVNLQPQYITLDDYENLPSDIRAEVIEGQIFYMSSPSQAHQTISLELSGIINSYIKRKKGTCKIFTAPFDVKLADNPLLIVQPDIMIICDLDKLDGKRCNGAPDFIIEIVSPGNASDDYVKKLYYYQKYGVREYWIVDPMKKSIFVNYFEGERLSIPYTFDSIIKVNIYEDLYIDFSDISAELN